MHGVLRTSENIPHAFHVRYQLFFSGFFSNFQIQISPENYSSYDIIKIVEAYHNIT